MLENNQTPNSSSSNGDDSASPEACSIIRLQNGMVLYLREINKSLSLNPIHLALLRPLILISISNIDLVLLHRYLALICLMRKESIEKQGLVDYNVQVFQNALEKVFEMRGV